MAWTARRLLLIALALSVALFFRSHPISALSSSATAHGAAGGELHPAVLARALQPHDYAGRQRLQRQTDSGSTASTRSSTTPTTTPSQTPSNTPSNTPSTTPSTTPSQTPTTPTTPATPSDTGTSTPPPTDTATQTSPPADVSQSTNAEGEVITITITRSHTSTPSSTSTEPAKPSTVKTPTIIGLSVAGGIAVVAVVAFVVWKMTRKKFSDFDSDGEAIKWPELNNETHALPARPTGRAGIDTSPTRPPTDLYSDAASNSNSDMHPSSNDPYAVPPLPHQNPNQPYRDAGYGANSEYYDPYRGPVPQQFQSPPPGAVGQGWGMHGGPEVIPMSTYAPSSGARSHSPGPAMSYNGGYDARSASPAPTAATGRQSPGPQLAYGGPGPAQRRPSPGPAQAYGGYGGAPMQGRASPGPNAAYNMQEDAYGGIS